ncbi:hypothetical protein SDC9_180614 [bioreactor metagenome]|uniref:Uncharacterized protein n=1 Tax=bioreactor metagenome TaxID=1076179 RepID=A0A645H287_9ZZZZ
MLCRLSGEDDGASHRGHQKDDEANGLPLICFMHTISGLHSATSQQFSLTIKSPFLTSLYCSKKIAIRGRISQLVEDEI